MRDISALLIPEPPLSVLPSLACAVGLNEAIVLQQLHYLLRDPRFGKRIEEHQWIFNTVEQWRASYFPFWSIRTIKTIFSNLSRIGAIVTCQPEGRASRRKYYRINDAVTQGLCDRAKFVPSMVQQSSIGNVQNSSLPITKTTAKTSYKEESIADLTTTEKTSESNSPPFKTSAFPASPPMAPHDAPDGDNGAAQWAEDMARWFRATICPAGMSLPDSWPRSWSTCFLALVLNDARDDDEIIRVCEWAAKDNFWGPKFLTPLKLRQRSRDGVSYFDTFLAQMTAPKRNEPVVRLH